MIALFITKKQGLRMARASEIPKSHCPSTLLSIVYSSPPKMSREMLLLGGMRND